MHVSGTFRAFTLSKLCSVYAEELSEAVDAVVIAEFDTLASEDPFQCFFTDIPPFRGKLEDVSFKIVGRGVVVIASKRRTQAGPRRLAAT